MKNDQWLADKGELHENVFISLRLNNGGFNAYTLYCYNIAYRDSASTE